MNTMSEPYTLISITYHSLYFYIITQKRASEKIKFPGYRLVHGELLCGCATAVWG